MHKKFFFRGMCHSDRTGYMHIHNIKQAESNIKSWTNE